MALIYFVAFGQDYLDQFDLIYPDVVNMADVCLITNVNYQRPGVKTIGVRPPETVMGSFAYRAFAYKVIDFSKYDQVWYSDTDIVFRQSPFEDFKGIYVCKEPDATMANEHFCELLNYDERRIAKHRPGINSGIYTAPGDSHFWKLYEKVTIKAYKKRPWIAEQQALNWIYFHHQRNMNIKLFGEKDIGFPIKGIKGKYADHFNFIKNEEKIKWMR